MGPRANFECKKCQATYEDLPVAAVRCPVCGFKRGFRRLYDAIQVSTNGHRVAQVLDPMMEPQFNQAVQVRDEAKASEKRLLDHTEHALAVATPAQREGFAKAVPNGGMMRWLNTNDRTAMAAGAGINLGAQAVAGLGPNFVPRTESAAFIAPHLRRRVVPTRAD